MAANSQSNSTRSLKNLKRPGMECLWRRDYGLIRRLYNRKAHGYEIRALDSIQDIFPVEVLSSKEAFSYLTHVMIVVGKTGTGKTSLIDTLTNYSYGIKFDDDIRYTLKKDNEINAKKTGSQTKDITVYMMEKDDIRLGLIDTPGFCDTADNEMGKKIPKKLEELLDDAGHPTIHGICFVVKGSETTLGDDEKRVFNEVLKLFPKEAKSSTFACFTFCHDSKPPENARINFAEGINEEAIEGIRSFAFDNLSVLYGTKPMDINEDDDVSVSSSETDDEDSENDEGGDTNQKRLYNMNMKSAKKLFKAMKKSKGFDSSDISKLIKNRADCDRILSECICSTVRTCEFIIDLTNKENRANAGSRDTYCKQCNKVCCNNCLFPNVAKCDVMVIASAKGLLGFIKFPFKWIKNKLSDTRECQQCGHGLDRHAFVQAELPCTDAKEISRQIDEHLEEDGKKLHVNLLKLKKIHTSIQETAWFPGLLTMDQYKEQMINAVEDKCRDQPDAFERLREAFEMSLK